MPKGKFFKINSALTGFALSIKGNDPEEGERVCPFPDMGTDNQLWYEDKVGKAIRSRVNDMCLEIVDGELLLGTFKSEEPMQRLKILGDKIACEDIEDQVLDITGNDDSPGARVQLYGWHGGENQRWGIEHQEPKYCYIICDLEEKVMDVRDADPEPGAKVITWGRHDEEQDNQLWWEDKYGNIRSKMNDFVLDDTEGSVRLQPFEPDIPGRQWIKSGNKIVNKEEPQKCIQVKDAGDQGLSKHWKGRKLDSDDYEGKEHQRWKFEYI